MWGYHHWPRNIRMECHWWVLFPLLFCSFQVPQLWVSSSTQWVSSPCIIHLTVFFVACPGFWCALVRVILPKKRLKFTVKFEGCCMISWKLHKQVKNNTVLSLLYRPNSLNEHRISWLRPGEQGGPYTLWLVRTRDSTRSLHAVIQSTALVAAVVPWFMGARLGGGRLLLDIYIYLLQMFTAYNFYTYINICVCTIIYAHIFRESMHMLLGRINVLNFWAWILQSLFQPQNDIFVVAWHPGVCVGIWNLTNGKPI